MNKIQSQCTALSSCFKEVYLLCMSLNKVVLCVHTNKSIKEYKILNQAIPKNDFTVFWKQAKCLILEESFKSIYFRYDLSNEKESFQDFIHHLDEINSKTCCEIPTFPFLMNLIKKM